MTRFVKHASIDKGAAKRLLLSPDTSAIGLLIACREAIGEFYEFEPETLWLSLERQGIEVPVVNAVKIQAALTLWHNPAFYYDAIAYEKTCLAFDHTETHPALLEEATVAQQAWAVKETAQILAYIGDGVPPFQHEPCAYAAVVLHREGFVLAPEQLSFAQELLEGINRGAGALLKVVKERWAALDKTTLDAQAFDESPEGVQLARLASVALHVKERETKTSVDLAAVS